MSDRELCEQLAATTYELFMENKGKGKKRPTSLHAKEIAKDYYGGKGVPITGQAEEDVRKKLPKISQILRENYGCFTALLGARYFYPLPIKVGGETIFRTFRASGPTTMTEARRCLPHGKLPNGKPNATEGLYLLQDDDDLIWMAQKEWDILASTKKWKSVGNTVTDAFDKGKLMPERGGQLLVGGLRGSTLDNQQRMRELIQAWEEATAEVLPSLPPATGEAAA